MNPKHDPRDICIFGTTTIRDAMESIDKSTMGIALVVDSDGCLIGTVTDGDIRRAVLRGVSLDNAVGAIMNSHPTTATVSTDPTEIREIMLQLKLRHMPVVDGAGKVIDLVLLSDLVTIPLSNPDITEQEINAVLNVLRTPALSLGPRLVEFESKFASYLGVKHAIAVNSGTSGLHLCVKAMEIQEGDEVITTPFSFIASANCILYERARPVFVDIESKTLNIDVSQIEKKITSRTKAILPVHVFGNPVDMKPLLNLAQKYDLRVIEDACEAIGAEYEGRKVGTFGNCAVFAFYPNKQMTTGEGGVVATNDDKIASLCRSYRNQGRQEGSAWLSHERLGYNYRLSELQCALGIVQLERIEEILEKRALVAERYSERLNCVEGVSTPSLPRNVKVSWFVYVIRLTHPSTTRDKRDHVLMELRRRGIACNNYFPPIHLQPIYKREFGYKEGDYKVTEAVSDSTIALPFFNNLQEDMIDHICVHLQEIIRKIF